MPNPSGGVHEMVAHAPADITEEMLDSPVCDRGSPRILLVSDPREEPLAASWKHVRYFSIYAVIGGMDCLAAPGTLYSRSCGYYTAPILTASPHRCGRGRSVDKHLSATPRASRRASSGAGSRGYPPPAIRWRITHRLRGYASVPRGCAQGAVEAWPPHHSDSRSPLHQ